MAYAVKEIFKTLQGEGANVGRVAVFCRFAGCNLWSGREEDRDTAICKFCDTDFVGTDGDGGGKFAGCEQLAAAILRVWGAEESHRFVVFTGGEPLLQIDEELIGAVHRHGFSIAVETNGTIEPLPGLDWVCVSPKAGAPFVVDSGNELKLVFPQTGIDPTSLVGLNFRHFWLQPMDGPNQQENTAAAISYCLQHAQWKLSLQTHKIIGVP